MPPVISRARLIEPAELGLPGLRQRHDEEVLPTGINELDQLIGGVPRGAVTEIVGRDGSGRTSLVLQLLATATSKLEICAYVDITGSFDPPAAAAAGVCLQQIVWVRCGGELSSALRAADLLLQAGGFGTVVLDLVAAPVNQLRRIQGSFWHRFRLAVDSTPTIFLILGREGLASCSSLRLQARQIKRLWTGERSMSLFRGLTYELSSLKPPRIGAVTISARPYLT
jgi:hypothetical protein